MVINVANIAEGPNATNHTKRYMPPRLVVVAVAVRSPQPRRGPRALVDPPSGPRAALRGPRCHHQPWAGKTEAKGGKAGVEMLVRGARSWIPPPPSAPPPACPSAINAASEIAP